MSSKISAKKIYAKIIGKNCGSYPYRVGLNTLAHNGETFDASPLCGAGGLYYCGIRDVLDWLNYGNTLCIVEPVGQIVPVGEKFKTDKLQIVSMMDIGALETWEFLDKHDAYIYIHSNTLLQWAAKNGYLEVVKLLVERFNAVFLNTALNYAINRGHLEIADYLVKCGAKPSSSYKDLLQFAMLNTQYETVKFLLKNCTSIEEIDNNLRWAAENGHIEVVRLIIAESAQTDIHANNDYALRYAAMNGHFDIVVLLADNGANIHAMNSCALRWAAEHGHLEIVKFLVERGADVHADADYAARWAARNGHLEVVIYLVERGANISDGYALRWAAKKGFLNIVIFLESKHC